MGWAAVLALVLNGLLDGKANAQHFVNDFLFADCICRMLIVIHRFKVVCVMPTFWLAAGFLFLLALFFLLNESTGLKIVNQVFHVMKVLPADIDPHVYTDTMLQCQFCVFKYFLVAADAILMEAALVIYRPHPVHSDLKVIELELIHQVQERFQVVSVGDGADFHIQLFAVLTDGPYCLDIACQKGFPAVQGAVAYFVAPLSVVLESPEDSIDHLGSHILAQPLLSFAQAVPLKAVWTAEVAVVCRHDDQPDAASGEDSPVYAAQELQVSQFAFHVLAGKVTTQQEPFPDRQGQLDKISSLKLICIFLWKDIHSAVKAIYQKSPVFDFLFFPVYQRQDYFVCT